MRLLRAFFVALLTAVVGCVLAFFVGDYLTKLAHVPEMAAAPVFKQAVHVRREETPVRIVLSRHWRELLTGMLLVLLGRLKRAVVRPPLVKLQSAEIARIRLALIEAGLLDATGKRAAA